MQDFYNLSQAIQGNVFGALYRLRQQSGVTSPPPAPLLQVQGGYAESPAWYLVQAAEFDPVPLTVDRLRVRDIYASERLVGALLDLMTAAQIFDRHPDESYHLTRSGRDMMTGLLTRSIEPIVGLSALVQCDMDRLAALLTEVIAFWQADGSRDSWCLDHSRNRAPDAGANSLLQIVQVCSDFNAYRDDAHMAAWRDHGVSGIAWESFSYVCGGQAASAETLFTSLAYRGYSSSDFAAVLDDLTERGWVTQSESGEFGPTEHGTTLRAAAEQATDDYFYAAWEQLGDDSSAELWTLMNELNNELQTIGTTST